MKKCIIIFILFSIGSSGLEAQETQTRRFINGIYQLDEFIKRQDKFVDYKDTASYNGTPYNNPSFLPGNVYQNKKLMASNVALRYNAVADEIEIKEYLETPISKAKPLPKSPDIFVKIVDAIFVFVPYLGRIEDGGYFQVLYEGDKIDIFKKLNKKFYPAKPAKTSITRNILAKFEDRPVYYLVAKNGKFYELPSARSKKLKVFGKYQEVIKKFVAKNKLNLNNEEDLIDTIIYFNSLENIEL
ncbi:hypothetical protein [Rasiella sp. SM2506]|uniref:hypothetical protein n=1 Tax=Rasiella sp. SM2506 TaxID=3423914 RepID=UPI003D78E7B7